MIKSLKYLALSCAALSCFSCENEDFDNYAGTGVEITLTATREGAGADSRTVRLPDGSVRWVPGDEISVFYNSGTDGGSKFTCQNNDTTDIAEFKGTLAGVSAGGENYTDGKYLYAIYPYSASNSFNDGVATITLPTYQTAEEGSFQSGLFPTMARAQSHNLAFYNICGGVKFTVTRDDITSVCFKGNNGERLTGTAKVTFDENELPKVLDEAVESVDSIIIYAPDRGTFKAGAEYFMAAYPTQLASGYTMTFRTSAMKEGKVVSDNAVVIERSTFGVLSDVDTRVTEWTDATTGGGGTNSGIYLGIVGFNQHLYTYPIVELTETSKSGLNSFIDGLTMKDGTVLYYSVDQALDRLQSVHLPSDLATAAIVTFTDGLDEGSTWKEGVAYDDEMEYLDAMNRRIKNETVSGLPITAYSIGLKGQDVSNDAKFRRNLEKLASSDKNWTEVSSMDEVNAKFKEIARQLSSTSYYQTINLTIPGKATGTKIRFTFDNVKRAEDSKLYIEGTLNKEELSLENVEYVGMESTSGTTIKGTRNDIFVTFTFEGVHTSNNKLLVKNFIEEYTLGKLDTSWQRNSEFNSDEDSHLAINYKSAVIMFVLDCSSSLAGDFVKAQNNAKDFISILSETTDEGNGSGEYQGEEWIDPEFAKVLQQKGYIKNAATVRPSEVEKLTQINVSGTSSYNRGSLTSLRGIEYFSSLCKLYCQYNQLSSLDLSWNRELTVLNCGYNQLTDLDISRNKQLTSLRCYSNILTSLDVSNNTQLSMLWCDSNNLTSLDVSKNTRLNQLYCDYNKLTSLDISNNTELFYFTCHNNPGSNKQFRVKSWFDNNSVPSTITSYYYYKSKWTYGGSTVTIYYYQ